MCLVLCMMQACVTYQIYTIRSFTSAYCTLCIHTTSVTSHRMSMGAVLTYAAVWRLVHSQWISSSIGSVIKVSIRPLQLWNRTLHAEHGRRSSAIRTIIQVCFAVTQNVLFVPKQWLRAAYFWRPLRFWLLWRPCLQVWCCRWSWTCRWAGF